MMYAFHEPARFGAGCAGVAALLLAACSDGNSGGQLGVDPVMAVPETESDDDAMDDTLEDEEAEEHDHAADATADAAVPPGMSESALSESIPTFNGCPEEDFVDESAARADRVIRIAPRGLVFEPKCMIIEAGQTVRWEGNLTAHPLAPGNADDPEAGSPDSPIELTSTGRSVEFEFETPGTYPYFCTSHGFGPGRGMSGVVHVR